MLNLTKFDKHQSNTTKPSKTRLIQVIATKHQIKPIKTRQTE